MLSPRPQSVPVFLLVRTAFQLLWQQKDDALRLGLAPVLICFGGFLYGQQDLQILAAHLNANMLDQLPDGVLVGVIAMSGILLLAYCLITVNWLRFVLLGPMASVGLGVNIGRSHGAFLLAVIGLILVIVIVLSVATMPASLLPGIIGQLASVAVFILVAVLSARFIPFLVAIAVGQPMGLRQSWMSSRGNGIPLTTALVLAYAPFLMAVMLVSTLLSMIGFAVAAPVATLFITALFQVSAWICQAGVLATAYRHMVGIRV
ncbi:MAG: hypothetical protein ACREEP_17605 [Dongiaceae bacterium]